MILPVTSLQSDTLERKDILFWSSAVSSFVFVCSTLWLTFSLFQNWLDSGSIRSGLCGQPSHHLHHHHQQTIWLPIMDWQCLGLGHHQNSLPLFYLMGEHRHFKKPTFSSSSSSSSPPPPFLWHHFTHVAQHVDNFDHHNSITSTLTSLLEYHLVHLDVIIIIIIAIINKSRCPFYLLLFLR